MKLMQYLIGLVVVLVLGVLVAGQLGLLAGKAPQLGVRDGRLKPPSATPNSVSSQAGLYPDHVQKDYALIAPLSYQGDAASGMQRLASVLQNMERTVIVTQSADYLYAQSSTALLKFTDDLEFLLDAPHNIVHVRSSSRLGRKDFGVNRQRVEAIRAAFAQ